MSGIDTPDWMEDEEGQQVPQVPTQPGTAGSIPVTSSLANPNTRRKAATGFVNLKKYVQANQDNNIASQVLNPAQSKLQAAGQTLGTAQQQFQSGIAGEKAKLQGVAGKAQQSLGYIGNTQTPGLNVQAVKPTDTFDPEYATKLTQYQDEMARLQRARDAEVQKSNTEARANLLGLRDLTYSGPRELNDAQNLAAKAFELDDFAKATATESGRGAILQTLFGKGGNYTGGSRNLDNLLLSSKPNLEQMRQLRGQTTRFGQDLDQAQRQAIAQAGTARGDLGLEKAKQALAMRTLRESLKSQLEAKAQAYNQQQQADAATIDDAELKQWLPEMAGYTLEPQPMSVGLPVEGSDLNNWVNLYKNKGFESHEMVDPNRKLDRSSERGADLGRSGWSKTAYGLPNEVQALVDAQALKPLFSESYQDNTWDSIDAEALQRRNILSEVLQDASADGVVSPKEKQELQVAMDQTKLSNLRGLPKGAEDAFINNFYQSQGNIKEVMPIINNPQAYGFQDARAVTDFFGIDSRWESQAWQDRYGKSPIYQTPSGMDMGNAPGRIAQANRNRAILERLKQELGITPDQMKLRNV